MVPLVLWFHVFIAKLLSKNIYPIYYTTRCCMLRRAKNTPIRSFVSRTVNLERGDTVQVTMPKPYIKYKIISSSRS
jgi:hypothetical protein